MGFGYGMNENQNHLVGDGRTTSRVLSEPGGKSSIHLGWDSPKKSSEFVIEFSFAKNELNTAHHLFCHPISIGSSKHCSSKRKPGRKGESHESDWFDGTHCQTLC